MDEEKDNLNKIIESIAWLNIFLIVYCQFYYQNNKKSFNQNKVSIKNMSDGVNDLDILINSMCKLRESIKLKGKMSNKMDMNQVKEMQRDNEKLTQEMLKLDMVNCEQFKTIRKEIILNIQAVQEGTDKICKTYVDELVDF